MIKLDYFAVGTYTDYAANAPNACGDGIVIISLNPQNGEMKIISAYKNIKDPTYLNWSSKNKKLYCCSENSGEASKISSFTIQNDLNLNLLAKDSNKSKPLCHITSLINSNILFSASYSGGCYNKYIDDGETIKKTYTHTYSEGSHAHQVIADKNEKYIYICDLGSDKIWIDSIQENNPTSDNVLELPKGYGPRHLTFDSKGKYAYILCELTPVLIVTEIDQQNGKLKIIREYPTVKAPKNSKSSPAAIKIHPSGKTLAVSNRVDNTISIFKIDGDKLELFEEFDTKGDHTRDISFTQDESWLLIANQNSSDIQIRAFEPETGEPRPNWGETLKIGTPVCIVNLTTTSKLF